MSSERRSDDASPHETATNSAHRAAIKLHQLRYVVSAAEHGSFRRAASSLEIQQSTISRRVRELEDRLGVSIFERGPSGVQLTKVGARFLDGAQGAMAQLDQAVDAVGAFAKSEQGVVRIGILTPLGPGFLDDLLRAAVAKGVVRHLAVTEASSRDHVAALQAGRLDIALLVGRPTAAGCLQRPLWRERLAVALPAHHALAASPVLRWSDLLGHNVMVPQTGPGREIEDFLVRRISRRGGQVTVQRQSAGSDTLLHLVAMGQGLMVAPESAFANRQANVVYRPMGRDMLSFSAAWSRRNSKPALRRLLRLAEGFADPRATKA